MPARERPVDIGTRRASAILRSLGDELHEARLSRGLSQAHLARLAGLSQTRISRIERQAQPNASVRDMASLFVVVGLDLSVRAYPAGPPIRDVAHRALLERLQERAAPPLKWRVEVPIPVVGGQRAWDAVVEGQGHVRVAVEAETRLRDVQALQRRLALKRRDDPTIAGVLLLVSATRTNRLVVAEHCRALVEEYPLSARAILGALGRGSLPSGSGVVLI